MGGAGATAPYRAKRLECAGLPALSVGRAAARSSSADRWSAASRVSNPPGLCEPLAGANWQFARRLAGRLRSEADGALAVGSTRRRVHSPNQLGGR
jgi:hypothetical protein